MRELLITFLVVTLAGSWLLGGAALPTSLHAGLLAAVLAAVGTWGVWLAARNRNARRGAILRTVGRSPLARHRGPLLANTRR